MLQKYRKGFLLSLHQFVSGVNKLNIEMQKIRELISKDISCMGEILTNFSNIGLVSKLGLWTTVWQVFLGLVRREGNANKYLAKNRNILQNFKV